MVLGIPGKTYGSGCNHNKPNRRIYGLENGASSNQQQKDIEGIAIQNMVVAI